MSSKPNVVVVVMDTLRKAELGCYGNTWIRTPNIDQFAGRAVRFTRAFPEAMATIQVRRALHTGRRTFPFNNYYKTKWDIVECAGWQPMSNDEDTLAENLALNAEYHTGFVTDTLPYFAPGFNFQRGFWQWEYIRGQQQDRWKSSRAVPRERLAQYGDPDEIERDIYGFLPIHLANSAHVKTGEDTTTAHTFEWAMEFLDDNSGVGEPFYLLVDSFKPHEPWEAPKEYFDLYGDPNYKGRRLVHCAYAPAHVLGYTDEEVKFVHDQYCALVTLADAWFGKLMHKLDELGLSENTYVFLISDHGTNFCENPRNIIGKPDNAMYPTTVNIPLMVRTPGEKLAGTTCDELVYNLDVSATVYDIVGMGSADGLSGQSLMPVIGGSGSWRPREYVTVGFHHELCYVDDRTWVLTDIDGKIREIFDLESDPACQRDVSSTAADRFPLAWERLLRDAGGKFNDYRHLRQTDNLGEKIVRV